MRQIAPGDTVEHKEVWEVYDDLGPAFIPSEVRTLIDGLLRAR
jgi:hypothetical protein